MVILTGFTSGLPSSVCHPSALGKVERSMASAYWVVLLDAKANLEKMGERRTGDTSAAASITKGLPAVFFASKERAMGTSTVGIVVVPPFAGSRPARV